MLTARKVSLESCFSFLHHEHTGEICIRMHLLSLIFSCVLFVEVISMNSKSLLCLIYLLSHFLKRAAHAPDISTKEEIFWMKPQVNCPHYGSVSAFSDFFHTEETSLPLLETIAEFICKHFPLFLPSDSLLLRYKF